MATTDLRRALRWLIHWGAHSLNRQINMPPTHLKGMVICQVAVGGQLMTANSQDTATRINFTSHLSYLWMSSWWPLGRNFSVFLQWCSHGCACAPNLSTTKTGSINSPLSSSITPSLFHSRLKTSLLQILPTVAFLFFFRTDSTDSRTVYRYFWPYPFLVFLFSTF